MRRSIPPVVAVAALTITFTLAVLPAVSSAYRSELRRYPYLTDVVASFATVNWSTNRSAGIGLVKWGEVGRESCTARSTTATKTAITVNSVPHYQWKAQLAMSPDREYCYRVYLGTSPEIDLLEGDASPRFKTQLPSGSSERFSFAVFSDWGDTRRPLDQENVMTALANTRLAADPRPRFALTGGDNAYPFGTQANYGDLVQTGPGVSAVFGSRVWRKVGASLPLFPALGNHDMMEDLALLPTSEDCADPSNSSISAFLTNWPQDRAVSASGGRYCTENFAAESKAFPSAWYAFDAGNARFYVLQAAGADYETDYKTHWVPGAAQYEWLKNDLATHPRILKFAFFHFPLYSDSASETTDRYLHGPNSLAELLGRYGVDVAFTGHAHIYQRNRPDSSALVTYVTGGGGAEVLPIGREDLADRGCSTLDAYGIGWSYGLNRGSACGTASAPTSPTRVYHFLLVTVDGKRVTVTPVDELGRTFDVMTYDFSRYARPKESASLRVPLVIAYRRCALPGNRLHGPPLDAPACSPPTQRSEHLVVGTGDANRRAAKFHGYLRYTVLSGDTTTAEDEADVRLVASATDIRRKADLQDYRGELQARISVRLTDELNSRSVAGPYDETATTSNFTIPFTVPCTPNADAAVGANCSVTTSVDTVVPGAVIEGKRAIWEVGKVILLDGGPDGVASSEAGNTVFGVQGVFVP